LKERRHVLTPLSGVDPLPGVLGERQNKSTKNRAVQRFGVRPYYRQNL
jgi:hypothetical protein